jgi:hypothetical protein
LDPAAYEALEKDFQEVMSSSSLLTIIQGLARLGG